ncbi:MAG: hypothetical protein ABIP94_01755 [Planctomycetota bacterium]
MIVLGSGGSAFWQHYARSCGNSVRTVEAIRQFVREGAESVATLLRSSSVPNRVVDSGSGARVSMVRLAEAAGFGTVSPVSGLLVHPDYGPWVTMRAALLVDGQPFGPIADASITERFQPCCSCAQPCVSVGPNVGQANVGQASFGQTGVEQNGVKARDSEPCGDHGASCGSRSACPIGSEHRDRPGEGVHCHGSTAARSPRWPGFHLSRFLPGFLRR